MRWHKNEKTCGTNTHLDCPSGGLNATKLASHIDKRSIHPCQSINEVMNLDILQGTLPSSY